MNTRLLLHIIAPVAATSLLLLTLGVGAAWYVHRLQVNVSHDLLTNISGVRAGEELEILVRKIRTQLDYFLITGDRKYLAATSSLRPETEHWLQEAERWSLTPKEQELTGRARRGYQRFVNDLERLTANKPSQQEAKLVRDMIDNVVVNEILQPAHEFLDYNEVEVDQAIKDNQVFAERLVWGLLLLGTCGSAAGLLAGFGLARGINRRLVQFSVPIRNAAGRLDEVVGPITFAANADLEEIENVLHLISDRIGAIIDRLRQSERQVLHAEQLASVGQLAAGMAHELRNPLTSMKILVQAASVRGEGRGVRGEKDRVHAHPSLLAPHPSLAGRDLLVLEEEITRMEQLVQSFLQFARPPEIDKRTLEVRPLIEQAICLVAGRAAVTQSRIDFFPPAETTLANLDAGQFRQVLLNLLLNALEAGKSAGVVEVSLKNGPEGWLTIRVADSGCGLPVDLGIRIFDPFVTTKETGMGLGLSICKRIADGHGGEITAANRSEGGAAFTLRLPLVDQRE